MRLERHGTVLVHRLANLESYRVVKDVLGGVKGSPGENHNSTQAFNRLRPSCNQKIHA